MSRVYSDNPGGFRLGPKDPEKIFYPDIDGNFPAGIPANPGDEKYVRPSAYWDEGPGSTQSSDWDTVYNADYSYSTTVENARNTDTIIDNETGFVKAPLPPGSRSFILGPIVDSYTHNHGNDNLTRIGYIQKDTREFVLLGFIRGRWGADSNGNTIYQDGFTSGRVWNGLESSFTASNEQFTFAHLQWFHDQLKAKRVVKNAAYFFAGGITTVTGGGGEGQPAGSTQGNTPGAGGGLPKDARNNGPGGIGGGEGGTPNVGTPQQDPQFGDPPPGPYPRRPQPGDPDYRGPEDLGDAPTPMDPYGDLLMLAISAVAARGLGQGLRGLAAGGGAGLRMLTRTLKNMTKTKPTYRPTQAQYGGSPKPPSTPKYDPRRPDGGPEWQRAARNFQRQNPGKYNPFRSDATNRLMKQTEVGTQPNPNLNPKFRKPLSQSYEPTGDYIQEGLEELPIDLIPIIHTVLAEMGGPTDENIEKLIKAIKKYSSRNFGIDIKESIEISRERRRKILREIKQPYVLPEVKKEKYKPNFAGKYRAQNTPDVTASKQSDDMVRMKNSDGQVWRTKDKYWAGYETVERMNILQDRTSHGQMYFDSVTSSNSKDYEKITERFKDMLKDRELQEHLNTLAHEKAMREMKDDYISPFREKKEVQEQETMSYDNDPLMKKVAKRLKTVIDYPDKPSPAGYPSVYPEPPPSIPNRFDKLDPQSAEAMPATGDPKIDAKVDKARKLVKKKKK